MAAQNENMTDREKAIELRMERFAYVYPDKKSLIEKAGELWDKVSGKVDFESYEVHHAKKLIPVHEYLKKLGKGDFYVPPDLDKKYEYEYVSESMAIFSMDKESQFGKFIENELPLEDKTKGFHYVNPNNRPFESQLSTSLKKGNIVAMFYEAFAMHYGLIISPATMHQCMSFTISKFMDVCSEQMRKFVVDHEGKKKIDSLISPIDALVLEKFPKLEITSINYQEPIYREVMNIYDNITKQLTKQILADVKDQTLLKNVLADYPSMSPIDKLSNRVQALSAVKNYYTMTCGIICGFPFVVMRGDLAEWTKLREKVNRLRSFFLKCMVETFPHNLLETEEYKDYIKNHPGFKGKFSIFLTTNKDLIEKIKTDQPIAELPQLQFDGNYDIEGALYTKERAIDQQAEKISKESAKDESLEKIGAEIDQLQEELDLLRANGDPEKKEYELRNKIYNLSDSVYEKRREAEEKIKNQMPEYIQFLDYKKRSQEFSNVSRMYDYLTDFEYIIQNMYETRQGKDKTSFWNEAFSLHQRVGCGGPPYNENGWIFDLIMSAEEERTSRGNYVRFITGKETRHEGMTSNIQIEYVKGKNMSLTTGVLGYHQVNIAQEFGGSDKEKMIALEPIIHVTQEISLPN